MAVAAADGGRGCGKERFDLIHSVCPFERFSSLPSEKESPRHGPRRAHADESIACVATRHLIGQGGENPSTRCRPRVPDRDRASIYVDPIPVHRIGGGALPAFLPCRGV